MDQVLLLVVVALTVAAVVFGVTVLVTGGDQGLGTAEPDGRAVPLPGTRPLVESDVSAVRFDTTMRGYRMAQVDQALRRAAYDIGYKDELIGVLEAEVTALREGRATDADALRRAREAALAPAAAPGPIGDGGAAGRVGVVDLGEMEKTEPAEAETDKASADKASADKAADRAEADKKDEAAKPEPEAELKDDSKTDRVDDEMAEHRE